MDNDQVNRLYHGEIMSEQAQQRCRERIEWTVARATGPKVLDVGCSQGITCILLGRKGLTCLGVDIAEPQIKFAQEELSKEDPATQKRVRFELTDAREVSGGPFDTIILGEVLEHDENPTELLSAVKKLLGPDGEVIITVPYGYQPSEDHKRFFYLANFHALISEHFHINEMNLLNRNITCMASLSPSKGKFVFDMECLGKVEDLADQTERELYRVKSRLRKISASSNKNSPPKTRKQGLLAKLARRFSQAGK